VTFLFLFLLAASKRMTTITIEKVITIHSNNGDDNNKPKQQLTDGRALKAINSTKAL